MYDFITGLFHFWQFLYCPKEPLWESCKHLKRAVCQCPCFPSMTAINSSTKWGWDTLIPVPKRMLCTAHQHTVLWTIWVTALWQLVFSNPDRCSLAQPENWNYIFLLETVKIMQIYHFFPAEKIKRPFCASSLSMTLLKEAWIYFNREEPNNPGML